ncbi:MAG: YHS domain-containing (seleno)protein [Solimonas sp.]
MSLISPLSRVLGGAVLALVLGAAQAGSPINKSTFGDLAVDGYDVVAYQTNHRAVPGKREFQTDWQGAHWRFASAEHLKAFTSEPQRYAPQYGGYCAYAVAAKNDKVDIDPEAYTVLDGKLYLNYSKKVQAQWEADRAHYIEVGDRNWPALRDK